jgi:phospholipid/cholesterol/gamma-HCH transport system ATP-binding protein
MAEISVRNLSKTFGKNEVLKGINFEINRGESFVIMGGSGSGKSVLIKCIIGLMDPNADSEITLAGQSSLGKSRLERLHSIKSFGVLFQGDALFDSINIWRNIAFAGLNAGTINEDEAYKLAVNKLKMVGLKEEVAKQFPVELSGGMRKRVALARAIAFDPKIIFFDEPTAGLDPIMSGVISNLIKKCSKELGATTITITHDMNCAQVIADKAALLYKGNFIWYGEGANILNSGNEYLDQFVKGNPQGPMS